MTPLSFSAGTRAYPEQMVRRNFFSSCACASAARLFQDPARGHVGGILERAACRAGGSTHFPF